MRPHALAFLLLLFALAQAGPGAWSAGEASPWIVTPLWLVAMGGALTASLALFGLRRLQPVAELAAFSAAFASAALLHFAGAMGWSAAYLIIGVLLATLTRWWARCAHPEIHTRTVSTASSDEPVELPTAADRIGAGAAYLLLAVTATLIVARPWHQRWGATAADVDVATSVTAGRDALPRGVTRAVTIAAPAERVLPWLAQVGGDSLGARILASEPPRQMTLEGGRTITLVPVGTDSSRLVVRERAAGSPRLAALPALVLSFYVVEPAHFVTERGMLLGIKARAESTHAVGG